MTTLLSGVDLPASKAAAAEAALIQAQVDKQAQAVRQVWCEGVLGHKVHEMRQVCRRAPGSCMHMCSGLA